LFQSFGENQYKHLIVVWAALVSLKSKFARGNFFRISNAGAVFSHWNFIRWIRRVCVGVKTIDQFLSIHKGEELSRKHVKNANKNKINNCEPEGRS
jgi:hypothetical protein